MSNDTFISSSSMGTVGKRGRIFDVATSIFNISFKNVTYVFVKILQWGATVRNNRTYR